MRLLLLPVLLTACGGASPWADAEFRNGEALVTITAGDLPPSQVGPWTCEVAAWGQPTVALLRCPGVATREETLDLVARLSKLDGILEASPNLVRLRF